VADQAGLQELEARRRRTRQVPKPQHPKASLINSEPTAPEAPPLTTSTPAEPARLAALPVPPDVVDVPVTAGDAAAAPLRRRSRLRQTQVHLDDRADGQLTELKKRAVMAEVDLSASAVLRQALNEYVERHGYDGVVAWFAEHGRSA